ncbi:hypothetical protein [Dyadobacter sandarakinus]|uniref:Uncharacterized protein n=1 Tax=Dyadobacter sandarakinus TaxID=2747268 RepID=A0ABX7IB73_9BACT|nr:hypothetical protein [Dyadobacter sandarakinus]QRR03371.1 hypothetical protein HWI92_21870 [Dyadobacter sandarakinus]
MIKKTILALMLGLTGFQASLYAGTSPNSLPCIMQDKVAVRPDDLPEAVKSTLTSDAYAGWQVTSAFLITREDNSQYFEINLKKGEESMTANIDKFGKKVD